ELPQSAPLFLMKGEGRWSVVGSLMPEMKGPHRNGPFKEAFNHHFLLVYGTKGTSEENAWAWAKARYDAETWWYRGNGSVDVVADVDVRLHGSKDRHDKDRSIILYGNADTHALWKDLLGDSPVQVKRGQATIGKRVLEGE